MKSKRNSSIETLRIISMLLIIAQHYVFHGGYDRTIFDTVAPNVIYLKIISIFGYSVCTVFALITGYYMVKADTKKSYQKVIPIVLETTFYSVLIAVILLLTKLVDISGKDLIKQVLSVFCGNWYVVFYILILLFVPYVNSFLLHLEKKDYRRFLMLCFALFIVVQTFLGQVYDLNNLDFMLISYFFGAYVRLFKEDFEYKNIYKLLITSGCAFIIIASIVGMDLLGVWTGNVKFIQNDTLMVKWDILPSFAFSFFAFVYAVNRSFSNKLIDILASTVLGVYLIHDGLLKTVIWEMISPNAKYVDAPYLHSVVKIVLVFLVCALIDLIRQNTVERFALKQLKKTKWFS